MYPQSVGLKYGNEKVTSTTKYRTLGTRAVLPDGRVFRWSVNGAVALSPADLCQTAVEPSASTHTNALNVVGGGTTGVTTLTVVGVTIAVADFYADGYLVVDTSPGQGMYRIKSHEALTSAAAGIQVTFEEDDPLREALTSGTSKVGFRRNPYSSVIVSPTTLTGVVLGVSPVAVPASQYFWLQTWGFCAVNADTAPVAGESVIAPGASPGGVNAATSVLTDVKYPVVGWAVTAAGGADKAGTYIYLTIAP